MLDIQDEERQKKRWMSLKIAGWIDFITTRERVNKIYSWRDGENK